MDKCTFCEILKGKIPAEKVFENEYVYAFRDISPQAPVHILVIPKKHISSLDDTEKASDHELAECLRSVRLIAAQEKLNDGYRVISNCGPDACQSVDHLHFHILAGQQMADKIVFFPRLSECPKGILIKPTDDTYGYRWVYSNLHAYIIRIKINGEYCKNIFGRNDREKDHEYITEDWTIDEIRDAMTNKIVDRISGPVNAYYGSSIDHFVGNHIVGQPVFFCISVEDFKEYEMKSLKYICERIKRTRTRLFFMDPQAPLLKSI